MTSSNQYRHHPGVPVAPYVGPELMRQAQDIALNIQRDVYTRAMAPGVDPEVAAWAVRQPDCPPEIRTALANHVLQNSAGRQGAKYIRDPAVSGLADHDVQALTILRLNNFIGKPQQLLAQLQPSTEMRTKIIKKYPEFVQIWAQTGELSEELERAAVRRSQSKQGRWEALIAELGLKQSPYRWGVHNAWESFTDDEREKVIGVAPMQLIYEVLDKHQEPFADAKAWRCSKPYLTPRQLVAIWDRSGDKAQGLILDAGRKVPDEIWERIQALDSFASICPVIQNRKDVPTEVIDKAVVWFIRNPGSSDAKLHKLLDQPTLSPSVKAMAKLSLS